MFLFRPTRRSNKAIRQLEAEIKLLKWHKLANESAIQAALIRTKTLKRHDKDKQRIEAEEKIRAKKLRFRKIIEEEKAKPLQVRQRVTLTILHFKKFHQGASIIIMLYTVRKRYCKKV